MSRTRASILTLAAALAPAVAAAQDAVTLDPVILSAGLSPIESDEYGRASTVLTADEIEARGIATVQDALRSVPGVAVTSTGDTLTKLRIRGSEPSHVLVLIDGVKANSPGSGDYTFSGMTAADIDRIEVLRGPQSAIYGSNAAAGVISITTRRAREPGLHYGGGFEIGGLGTRAANGQVSYSDARSELVLSLDSRHVKGEDASRSGGDRDFNDRDTIGLRGRHDLTDSVSAGFALRRTWQDYGYDLGSFVPVPTPDDYLIDAPLTAKRNEAFGSLWLEAQALDGRLSGRLTVAGTNQDTLFLNDGAYDYDDAARRRSVQYLGSWAIDGADLASTRHRLNFSAATERESYRSSYAPGGVYERDTTALALEYLGNLDHDIDLQAGIRRDLNDGFKDATSWNLSAGWQVPGQAIRLRAAAGRAVVNPDMFQQFGYIPGTYQGNPDLRPERSLGYELGADLSFAGGAGSLGATAFHSEVEDLITGSGETSVNLDGTSTRKGLEVTASMQVTDTVLIGADYTYTDARQQDGSRVPRVPRHMLNLRGQADFAAGRGSLSAELRYVAGNYDEEWYNTAWPNTPATSELPEFATVNLAAHYDLTDNLRLHGRVENLFDKDYSEAWGYYGQGRTAYAGLQARW